MNSSLTPREFLGLYASQGRIDPRVDFDRWGSVADRMAVYGDRWDRAEADELTRQLYEDQRNHYATQRLLSQYDDRYASPSFLENILSRFNALSNK